MGTVSSVKEWFLFILILGATSVLFVLIPEKSTIMILAVLALVGGLVCFGNRRLLRYFLLLGLFAGQLLRIRLSNDSSGGLLLIDATTIAYSFGGLLWILLARKKSSVPLSLILLFGFIAWMILSLVIGSASLTTSELLTAAFYLIRFSTMALSLWVTLVLFPSEKEQAHSIYTLLVTGGLLVLAGFIQLIYMPSFADMAQFGWDPHEGRLLSTFFDPNYFGMFLVMLTSLFLAFLLMEKESKSLRFYGWGICFLLTLLALGATYSRSTYLAFLISAGIILAVRSWKQVLFVLIILALVAGGVPRIRERVIGAVRIDPTAQDRIESWKETGRIIIDHPLTGVGYNAFGPTLVDYGFRSDLQGHSSRGSDSSILLILATTGIIGFTLFCLFLLTLLQEILLAYRYARSALTQTIALALLGILPAYLIHSQFVNSIFYPLLFIPFGLLVAHVLAAINRKHALRPSAYSVR